MTESEMTDGSRLRLASESIPGRRAEQEDAVLVETLSDGRVVVAVADGMGGHAAGEVASALAAKTLLEEVSRGTALDESFARANEAVHTQAQEPGTFGMGTTLVALLVDGTQYEIGNVGDSRAYVIDAQGIRQITNDHSYLAEAVTAGQTREAAMASRWRDALTRSVGTSPEVETDVFGPFPVQPDSALVLCSDGCYKTLTDQDLWELYGRSRNPTRAAQALVAEAYERGSDDNISVAVVEFGQVPRNRSQAPTDAAAEAGPGGEAPTDSGEPGPSGDAAAGDLDGGPRRPWWRRIFG